MNYPYTNLPVRTNYQYHNLTTTRCLAHRARRKQPYGSRKGFCVPRAGCSPGVRADSSRSPAWLSRASSSSMVCWVGTAGPAWVRKASSGTDGPGKSDLLLGRARGRADGFPVAAARPDLPFLQPGSSRLRHHPGDRLPD